VFVGVQIARDWDQITDTLESAQPAWLAAAVVAGLVSMAIIGVNWLALIRRRGYDAPLVRGLSWFFTGQLGKYVPGGIWPVVGQAELAGRGGADRRSAYLATASSMAFTLFGAASVAAVSGLMSPNDRRFTGLLFAAGIAVVVASLAIPRLRAVLVRVSSSVTRGRAELPEGSVVALYTLRHVPVWVMFGIMNVFVLVALGGDLGPGLFVDVLFASSLSWIVGFVVIGVPGGIGVRESVFVALMTGPLGATLALSVAVAGRLVTIAVDLLGAFVAAAIARVSSSRSPVSLRSPFDVSTDEADHPDPVLQRGSDVAADGRRPAP
jgi:glycosyltransferase 2 family protein